MALQQISTEGVQDNYNMYSQEITFILFFLTLKQRETHGCIVNIVATDALVLKHQAISIHNAD